MTVKPAPTRATTDRADHPAIIVIGTSAGGMQALATLFAQLPKTIPAAVFVVQHMGADALGDVLVDTINRSGSLQCQLATSGQLIRRGKVYVAPPDQHLMISAGRVLLTKGARENRARPAIDPLFRSAAVAYGNRVIGVLLTGHLDDGTAGLTVVHRCGGTCVVQSPADAAFPDMPQNALNNTTVDYQVPLAEMGGLLLQLAARPHKRSKAVPADIAIEATIAERVLSDLPSVNALGEQVPFNCPGCGGVLWQMAKGNQLRYRCHTGHAYTAAVLLAEQTAKMEETLWVALRMFEENRNLLISMGQHPSGGHAYTERVRQSKVHIDRIRAMLRAGTTSTLMQEPQT